jgi:hypothetical protein
MRIYYTYPTWELELTEEVATLNEKNDISFIALLKSPVSMSISEELDRLS